MLQGSGPQCPAHPWICLHLSTPRFHAQRMPLGYQGPSSPGFPSPGSMAAPVGAPHHEGDALSLGAWRTGARLTGSPLDPAPLPQSPGGGTPEHVANALSLGTGRERRRVGFTPEAPRVTPCMRAASHLWYSSLCCGVIVVSVLYRMKLEA